MKIFTATKAREYLYNLIDETSQFHEPVQITGKGSNAVLIGETDWNSIQDTLYLHSIPKIRKYIIKWLKSSIDDYKEKLD